MYKLNEFVKTVILKKDPSYYSYYENGIENGTLPSVYEIYNPFFSPYTKENMRVIYMNQPFEKLKKQEIYNFDTMEVEWCERHLRWLIQHPYPVSLMERNPHNLDTWDWYFLSFNPYAIRFLESNFDNIHWGALSANPAGLELLSKCPEDRYIDYDYLTMNPALYELDFNAIREHMNLFKEELIQKALHPRRISRMIEMVGEEKFDLEYMI